MAGYAAGREIAAILTTGDNFYSDDVDELMGPFAWATEDDISFLIAWGNHDIDSETRIELLNDVFDDPPLWCFTSAGRSTSSLSTPLNSKMPASSTFWHEH